MPAGFSFPRKSFKLWVPLVMKPTTDAEKNARVQLIARLRPGLTLAAAKNEITTVTAPMTNEKNARPGWKPNLSSPNDRRVNPGPRRAILILFYAVGFVLLIACVNATNLLLARAASRHREIAIRTALGASRWRLVQQIIMESTILSLMGGACGIRPGLFRRKGCCQYDAKATYLPAGKRHNHR